ncbi:MAG: DUF6498-containing protein [Xanthomonadales bacterium]|nr:DUF6498-containing protein [Xanthomonadales bacterium]
MKRDFLKLKPTANDKPALALLLLANVLPLFMVFFEAWSVAEIMLTYWLENVVIGVLNLIRIALCQQTKSVIQKLFVMGFFTFHYGMFTMAHGAILFSLLVDDRANIGFGPEMVFEIVNTLHLWLPLLALFVSHGFSLVWHYLRQGEYKRLNVATLMMRPYGRVVLLHVVALVGGLVVSKLGAPVFALVLLIAIKTFVDAKIHVRVHQRESGHAAR